MLDRYINSLVLKCLNYIVIKVLYIYKQYIYILTVGPSYIIYIMLIRSAILIILVNAYSLNLF